MAYIENEDFIAKSLVIGVTVDQIMAEFNAFDWQEMKDKDPEETIKDFSKRLNFKNTEGIFQKAFIYKFERAILNLNALVEEVHSSYNIPSKGGISNEYISQYYYLKLWADKKKIAVNYNETDYNERKKFNFYTILFDIYADKLSNFNEYNRQKEKR